MNLGDRVKNNGRRNFITSAPLLALSTSLLPATTRGASQSSAPHPNDQLIPKTPTEYLNLYRKVTASCEDGKEAITTFSGITYGMTTDMQVKPLHGVNVAIFTRTQSSENGKVKFMTNIVGVYHDLKTGKILEDWTNPYTNKKVKAWHQINGPLHYELSPETNLGLLDAEEGTEGFIFPVHTDERSMIMSTHYSSNRKNPLQPQEYPLASTGKRLRTCEFNDWVVPIADIMDKSKPEADYQGSWLSLRPWRPFMQMGQKEGSIITPKVVTRVASISEVDPRILSYGEKNFPELLGAPKKWAPGSYKSNSTYFKEHYIKEK